MGSAKNYTFRFICQAEVKFLIKPRKQISHYLLYMCVCKHTLFLAYMCVHIYIYIYKYDWFSGYEISNYITYIYICVCISLLRYICWEISFYIEIYLFNIQTKTYWSNSNKNKRKRTFILVLSVRKCKKKDFSVLFVVSLLIVFLLKQITNHCIKTTKHFVFVLFYVYSWRN